MVSLRVSDKFFDKVFEPARIKTQKAFKLKNLSQPKFTEFIAISGGRLALPKKWRQKLDF